MTNNANGLDLDDVTHWRFWLLGFVAFALLLWLLSPVLLPFVAGLAIAYFMDPIADRLERVGLPRWLCAIFSLLLFLLVIVLMALLLVPLIQQQLGALIAALPSYAEQARTTLLPWIEENLNRLSPNDVARLRDAAGGYVGEAVSFSGDLLKGILTGGMAVFDVLTLLVITPVVAFYMLRDWDRLLMNIDKSLPRKHLQTIRVEARKVDDTLAGFIRGQALVCLCLGTYYAIALSFVGLDFGATIGIMAGVLSFIPYVGTILGFVGSMGLALVQFDSWTPIAVVALIYVIGQMVEGNVLSPKLVGDRVGLHPVWVIFALMAGGSLFGFLGVLVALPVAAVLGVLIRFMLAQYMASKYYSV